MVSLIQNVEFEKTTSQFQRKLNEDINMIRNDDKLTVKADKTTNYYKMEKDDYVNLVRANVTKTYKKTEQKEVVEINREAKRIAESLELGDRIDKLAEREVFITLKDHKDNFDNKPSCRLISPTKSEIGHISKVILDRIVGKVISATGFNLWKSTDAVLDWYKKIPSKQESSFINFDIVEFYPSITEKLLLKALGFAENYEKISSKEKNIIIHAKQTVVFNNQVPWKKRNADSKFDVTMGSFDGAESCELVVAYMLSILKPKYGNRVGLYRDDGLAVFKETPQKIEKIKKEICRVFRENDLKVTIEANKATVNFLDVTLDLRTGGYMPYMKPGNIPLYVHVQSNHPPTVIKQIPEGINKRLSNISSTKKAFEQAAPAYQEALQKSGHKYQLTYTPGNNTRKRARKREVTWYNPPYNKNVCTSIGKKFLQIIDKCFPKEHKLHKVLNRNTVKVSYSCMPNMKATIQSINKRKVKQEDDVGGRTCSCRRNAECPLNGECLSKNIVYQATVTSEGRKEAYVGLTSTTFKARLANHKRSFRSESMRAQTELSKHIWDLKDEGKDYEIKWDIVHKALPYSNVNKRCNLCIAEKCRRP